MLTAPGAFTQLRNLTHTRESELSIFSETNTPILNKAIIMLKVGTADTNKGHTTVGRDRHHHVDSFSRLVVHVYVHRPFATENCAMNRVRLQTVALDFCTASYFALATSIASRPWCSDMNT